MAQPMISNKAHWQLALDDGIVEGIDDLRQAIMIILLTRRGQDALRPDFGSELWRYIDYPIDRARPHLVRESVEAIRRFEPRVRLTAVHVSHDGARVTIAITFTTPDGARSSMVIRP